MENRKEQIEKIILKELHDMETMKKVRMINERSKRPVSRKIKTTKQEISQLGGDPSAFKGTLAHLQQARNNLRNMQATLSGGDDSREEQDNTKTLNKQDEIEDRAVRSSASFVDPSASKTPPSAEEQGAKESERQAQINRHLDTVSKVDPELSAKKVTGSRAEQSAEETSKRLSAIDRTHPHLSNVTKTLRKLLGVN